MTRGLDERTRAAVQSDAVYPADPLRLLESVPELELFLSDRRVRGGIERGRPHDVYRALYWARRWGRFRAHRETLDLLLADRRLFVAPLERAPALFTYNGFGLTLYGQDEARDDGGYIATHFVVAVFIPVFPIASYLCCSAGGNAYRFFGRAPFGTLTWMWNRLVVLGIAASVLMGLGSAIAESRYTAVEVLNGLPFPVVAHVCGAPVTLAPGTHESVTADVGRCLFDVRTVGGEILETRSVTLSAGHELVVWNVLGAAPLFLATVRFGPVGAGGEPPEPRIFCGEHLVELDDVDYPFVDPPSSMRVRDRDRYLDRTHVDVAEVEDLACSYELMGGPRRADGLALAAVTARGLGYEPGPTVLLARNIAALDAGPEALALLRSCLTAHEDALEVHLELHAVMLGLNRRAEALAEYRDRAVARPDDADAAYLAERLDPSPGGTDRWIALAERFATQPRIALAVGHTLCDAGRFEEGAARFETAELLDPELAAERRAPRALCLVGAGRTDAALALVEDGLARTELPYDRAFLGALHVELSAVADPPRVSAFYESHGTPEERTDWGALYRALSRRVLSSADIDAVPDPMLQTVVRVLVSMHTDPRQAVEHTATLTSGAHSFLPIQVQALLLGEAARDRESAATEHLVAHTSFGGESARAMIAFVHDGVETDLVSDLPRDARAGLYFARSRMPGLAADVRDAALARAHDLDVVPTWIRTAEEGWAAP